MKLRPTPLADPPNRLPYLKVVVGGQTFWARTPSLLTIAHIAKVLDRSNLDPLLELGATVVAGQSLLRAFEAVRDKGGDVLELAGCLVGIGWADPAWELETPRPDAWTAESMAAFGGPVWEELHEAGWKLGQVVGLMLALIEQITAQSSIEGEVLERARFFARPRVTTISEPSTPSAPSSVVDPAPSEA